MTKTGERKVAYLNIKTGVIQNEHPNLAKALTLRDEQFEV
jgi:hypothetical protein